MSDEIGPVEYLIVAFPGNKFRGEIAPALADLVEAGTIRIMDIAFVGKDEDGNVAAFELMDLDPDVREGLENLGAEVTGLFSEEDLEAAAEELEPNTSAALLVWEDVWAREVAQAMRDAGGVLFDFGRLPHEVVQAARDYAWQTSNQRRFEMPLMRRGPGLIGTAARTGVAMGVAGRVRHRQEQKWAAEEQDQYAQQAPPPPPAPAPGRRA